MSIKRLLTVGYEGKTITEFVALLVAAGVRRVVDVRQLPLSRRRGFSKTKLSAALDKAGIEYVHVRAAGNPHRSLKADVTLCLHLYANYIDQRPDVLDTLAHLAVEKKTALLCVEADPDRCHRSVLVERLTERAALHVQHL